MHQILYKASQPDRCLACTEHQHSDSRAQRGKSKRTGSHERLSTIHSGIPGLTHRPSKGAAGRRQVVGDSEQGKLSEPSTLSILPRCHDRFLYVWASECIEGRIRLHAVQAS